MRIIFAVLLIAATLATAACESHESQQVKERGDYRSRGTGGYGPPR